MSQTLTEKILAEHLVDGKPETGQEIGIEIDHVLAPDTSGTMIWLQFGALNLGEVQTEVAVQYADHNTYQRDFRNTDDHRFLRSAAGKYGAHYSKAGNGICHQVQKENFVAPGKTLIGGDSHTPTAGGLGQLAFGSGGIDVAVALGGGPYYFEMPEIVEVRLEGELQPWATAKDVILEMLRLLSVKGGVGKIFEYTGPGVETLSVPERTTITNMGVELGATTSLFPSDQRSSEFLTRLGREDDYRELGPDPEAEYDDRIILDLSQIEPSIARPSMPDNVVPVREVAGTNVDQVIVGSCTNGSYADILPVAKMLSGRSIDRATDMVIAPGSKQASELLARNGWTAEMMAAGVNFSEATCGACIGLGHVPASDSVSLRTFNRNFQGRTGLDDDSVYLCSPEVATAAALTGEIVDPRDLAAKRDGFESPVLELADEYLDPGETDLIPPGEAPDEELLKGPNIGDVHLKDPLGKDIAGPALLIVGDDITTDHIIPATSDILMYRSNIPEISKFTFKWIDESFAERALESDGGFVVAGENYGQGSAREHAALCPMYLGLDGVLARSFARIHKANLFNFGLLPLTIDEATYRRIAEGETVEIVEELDVAVRTGQERFTLHVGDEWEATGQLDASDRERDLLAAGGALPYMRERFQGDGTRSQGTYGGSTD